MTRTIETTAIEILMVCLSVLSSGCATSHVSRIGISYVHISPRSVSRTTNGNVVVEMRFSRRNFGIPLTRRDMGPRYALLDGKAAEGAVRTGDSWSDERGTHVNLKISRFVQTDNVRELCQTPDWYLWPANWSNIIKRGQLPSNFSVATNSTVLFETRTDILWTAQLPQEVDGKPYFISIQMFPDDLASYSDSSERHMWVMDDWPTTGEEQQARWAPFIRYPLYIPSLAFDVVTFPVQIVHDYFMFLDGMAAMGP